MKFQDDISMPHTHTHTHTNTDKPKPTCPPLFQSWGHNNESHDKLNMMGEPYHETTCVLQMQTINAQISCATAQCDQGYFAGCLDIIFSFYMQNLTTLADFCGRAGWFVPFVFCLLFYVHSKQLMTCRDGYF